MAKTTTTQKQGLDQWLEARFNGQSHFRTPGQFENAVQERRNTLSGLTPAFQEIRDKTRALLGLQHDAVVVLYGEQATGLNEPSLILGKRLLATVMDRRKGWEGVEYLASSDVIGSEIGMRAVTVPNPHISEGTEVANTVAAKHKERPAHQAPSTVMKLDKVAGAFTKVYGGKSSRSEALLDMLNGRIKEQTSLADLQNALLNEYRADLGLGEHRRVVDVDFETVIARTQLDDGATVLEFMLKNWGAFAPEFAKAQDSLEVPGVSVPDPTVAPIYAYPEGAPTRLRILYKDPEDPTSFVATHPFKHDRVIGEFGVDRILSGEIPITFRAIPRAMILSLAFDAHISGGGAQYNQVVGPVFKALTGADHYPIAHMDNQGPEGDRLAVFQYSSLANRSPKASHRWAGERAVVEGRVSLMDMWVSTRPDAARTAVAEVLADDDFSMATRVQLPRFEGEGV